MARRDRERRVLQRGGRARAAHVHGGREPERVDAEVGGELLAGRVAGRRDDAVDVGGGEPGVGDGGVGRLQDQLDGRERRAADVVGLADADDRGASSEAEAVVAHETADATGSRLATDKQKRPPRRCEGRFRSSASEVR